jgi:hypothetical protein
MTKREKIVVSAYTGILMCEFNELQEYAEPLLNRPVYTHEFSYSHVVEEIKQRSRAEFLEICKKED